MLAFEILEVAQWPRVQLLGWMTEMERRKDHLRQGSEETKMLEN